MSHDVVDFQKDVIARSAEVPVLVDFWAEWCGPCKTLGPVLERLAMCSEGRWELKKLNTEDFPDVAAEYGVRSIPNVKLFVAGKAVDEFIGALPEKSVETWLARALPDDRRKALDHAEQLLQAGERKGAASILSEIVPQLPNEEHPRALLALAILFEDPVRAAELVKGIHSASPDGRIADAVATIGHLTAISSGSSPLPPGPERENYLAAAQSAVRQEFSAALRGFIDVIKADRTYDDDGGRKACLAIFVYLGEEDEVTRQFRREFSSALFV